MWCLRAGVHGAKEQDFPGIAFDEIAGPLVLAPRQATSQIVRIDQGPLKQFLDNDPTVAMQVYATLMTNPVPGSGKSALMPGVGGYGVEFTKMFSRVATPAKEAQTQQAMTDLKSGTPRKKIRAMELLSRFAQGIMASKDADEQLKKFAGSLIQSIHRAQTDEVPAVAAYASYVSCTLSNPQARLGIIRSMVAIRIGENGSWRWLRWAR